MNVSKIFLCTVLVTTCFANNVRAMRHLYWEIKKSVDTQKDISKEFDKSLDNLFNLTLEKMQKSKEMELKVKEKEKKLHQEILNKLIRFKLSLCDLLTLSAKKQEIFESTYDAVFGDFHETMRSAASKVTGFLYWALYEEEVNHLEEDDLQDYEGEAFFLPFLAAIENENQSLENIKQKHMANRERLEKLKEVEKKDSNLIWLAPSVRFSLQAMVDCEEKYLKEQGQKALK